MKTITTTTNVYSFAELSEDAKQKAIENLSDINVDYDWWEFTYEDAENIGLKITGFDIDRGNYCDGEFIFDAQQVAEAIIKDHGKDCETYKTASNFLSEYQPKYDTWYNSEDQDYDVECELEDLKEDFLKSLCEDYRIMLRNEYEYQISKEAIIETIEANEYQFTEDGKLF